MRCDRDPSILKLKKYLSDYGVFLQVKRGRNRLGLVDIYLKHLKTKMVTYLKINTDTPFPKLLKDVVESYNNTRSDLLQDTPRNLNSNYFDAILRQR